MKILLHVCCAPCATYPFDLLIGEGHQVDGYFYNPNVHPFQEYLLRLRAVEEYAEKTSRRIIISPRYDFEEFFRSVSFRETGRCRYCYRLRLKRTATVARKGRYDAFTTTLLISRQQKHDLAREIGEEVAAETGAAFLYRDFRPGWKEHWELTEKYGLYKQQYCGCLYSEHERFKFSGENLKP